MGSIGSFHCRLVSEAADFAAFDVVPSSAVSFVPFSVKARPIHGRHHSRVQAWLAFYARPPEQVDRFMAADFSPRCNAAGFVAIVVNGRKELHRWLGDQTAEL
jgi:hypothetical protein